MAQSGEESPKAPHWAVEEHPRLRAWVRPVYTGRLRQREAGGAPLARLGPPDSGLTEHLADLLDSLAKLKRPPMPRYAAHRCNSGRPSSTTRRSPRISSMRTSSFVSPGRLEPMGEHSRTPIESSAGRSRWRGGVLRRALVSCPTPHRNQLQPGLVGAHEKPTALGSRGSRVRGAGRVKTLL